jgi:hypothetical protein
VCCGVIISGGWYRFSLEAPCGKDERGDKECGDACTKKSSNVFVVSFHPEMFEKKRFIPFATFTTATPDINPDYPLQRP